MVREPAVAGSFYPAEPMQLARMVDELLAMAQTPPAHAPKAVVAPHAGYAYSGPVAAYSFRALEPLAGKTPTVFLMGPAHYLAFEGVSTGNFTYWETPLGQVPVDTERVGELLERSALFTSADEPHTPEHSLEVELPFLQAVLGEFKLVPLLFGLVDPLAVAGHLDAVLRPGDLVVVSTDLSHYHPDAEARKLDAATLEAALALDARELLQREACGRHPWAALTALADRRSWRPELLAYATSGDTSGDRSRVVGYAALRYD
ncbi:AmmeMemoRadiSam system protein B [Oceanithermus desulfurans]